MDLGTLDAIDDPHALRDAARALLTQVMTERDHAVVERDTARAQVKQQAQLIDARERTISHRDAQIAALTAEIARLRRVRGANGSTSTPPAAARSRPRR